MSGSKGYVMWPRLVASKILKNKRILLGSNNFVADIPYSSTDHCSFLELEKEAHHHQYHPTNSSLNFNPTSLSSNIFISDHANQTLQNYKVFVSTWNVGGVAPSDDFNMDELLDPSIHACHIYVFGFQEVVPLKVGNVLGPEKSKISSKWNSIIREALNKRGRKLEVDDDQGRDENINTNIFKCIISKQMVGILISVWVRNELRLFVRNPNVSCVGCGFMGCLGNKGSVSVRFRIHETSFCFVCSHLASGGREGDERMRNENAAEIFSRTIFPRGPSLDLPRKILDHDVVIFLGDLNYRISLPESATRLLASRREWNSLLEYDQLRVELADGGVLEGWQEGMINFAPTYKYYPNSDEYCGSRMEIKKGEKKRAPAWCDRIIWYGEGLKQHLYERGESKMSDHRPVRAIFSTQVRVTFKIRALQNFFLSERFQHSPIPNCLELHSGEEDFPCISDRFSFQIKDVSK